jgi:uncharacterized protein (DUF486 family)
MAKVQQATHVLHLNHVAIIMVKMQRAMHDLLVRMMDSPLARILIVQQDHLAHALKVMQDQRRHVINVMFRIMPMQDKMHQHVLNQQSCINIVAFN